MTMTMTTMPIMMMTMTVDDDDDGGGGGDDEDAKYECPPGDANDDELACKCAHFLMIDGNA